MTDEVYEHIVYAPNEHISMASLPGMFEHTITCNSLSKTYSITGWRLGYLIGPAEVIEAARKVHDFLALPQFAGWTDFEFCEWMIREIGVAAVPGSSFFREPVNHLIRMHFARGTEVLDEAVRRLEKLTDLLK